MDAPSVAASVLGGGAVRRWRERAIHTLFMLAAAASIVALVGIFGVLVQHAVQAFTVAEGLSQATLTPEQRALFSPEELAELPAEPPPPPTVGGDFLFGERWNPSGRPPTYGALGMVASTVMVTLASLLISAPLGVGVGAWLAFVARPGTREVLKPLIEVLAAVPSVVVGFVGLVFLAPALAGLFGLTSGLMGLNGALLLAVMSLPTIVSLTEDAVTAVPRDYVAASLALGADRWQTLVRVVLPAARSGIIAAVMLGMGRAIGETMTVLMACGNAVAMPRSLFDPVRTLTATVAIELGEVPQDTRHFYMLFAVGLVLFCMTFVINLASDVLLHRRATGPA